MRFISILFLFFCKDSLSAKILGVFPVPGKSHYILGNALMKGLAEKGHDVTVISAFVDDKAPKNGSYRNILIEGLAEEHERRMKDLNFFQMGDTNIFLLMSFIMPMLIESTEYTLKDSNVQKLLQSDEEFDLVIVEQFNNDAHKGFACHFNAPLMLMSTIGANSWTNLLVGNPAPPAYVSEMLLGYSDNMSFREKIVNVLFVLFNNALTHWYSFPQHGKLFKSFFPKCPPWNEVLYNSSIVLLNSHPSTNQPVPYVPNMVDIGGFHVKPPNKLPQDLQIFLDGAPEGVVYFSMGSNVKSKDFPEEKKNALLKTFKKLKQKVLWKWEDDDLPGKPENVKVGKWLPQQDILAHPNVKLFITHGGLLSTIETIYHGVPVLAIPIAADQKLNAQNMVNQGVGLQLSYEEVSSEEKIFNTINELLTNSKFKNNVKKRSEIFHDRIRSPMETAVYWAEYLIRHGGAPHLRVAGVDLPFYIYHSLDVIAFVFAIIFLVIYLSFKLISKLCCLGRKQKVKTT